MSQVLAERSKVRLRPESDPAPLDSGFQLGDYDRLNQAWDVSQAAGRLICQIDDDVGWSEASLAETAERDPRKREAARKVGRYALLGSVQLAAEVYPEELAAARQLNQEVADEAALATVQPEASRGEEKSISLAEDFRLAAQGNEEAHRRVLTNSRSEVAEMALKSGSEMIAEARFEDGSLNQFGQTTRQRQYNTLTTFSVNGLQEVISKEGQNAFLIDKLLQEGVLQQGYKVVELSLVPDLPHGILKDSGLFLREVTAIIRVTEADSDNNVKIKSYLVGGTDQSKLPHASEVVTSQQEEAVEKVALANRFDIAAARRLLSKLGIEGAESMSPEEILGTPIIIPAEYDGIDATMIYDEAVFEVTGKRSMLGSADIYKKMCDGRAPSRADYQAHFANMRKLQDSLREVGERVSRQCIERWSEVAGDNFAASRLMHEIAEREVAGYFAECVAKGVGSAVQEVQFMPDLTVLGAQTYQDLQRYQQLLATGNLAAAQLARNNAIQSARGTGCPTGSRQASGNNSKGGGEGIGLDGSESEAPGDASEGADESDENGSLSFKCPKGHWNKRERGGWVYNCRSCGIDVSCGKQPEPIKPTKPIFQSVGEELFKIFVATLATPEKRKKQSDYDLAT